MKLRYRLLKWLAMGDLVVMNAEIDNDGVMRPRNCGEILIADCEIRMRDGAALAFTNMKKQGILSVVAYKNPSFVWGCRFIGIGRGRGLFGTYRIEGGIKP